MIGAGKLKLYPKPWNQGFRIKRSHGREGGAGARTHQGDLGRARDLLLRRHKGTGFDTEAVETLGGVIGWG